MKFTVPFSILFLLFFCSISNVHSADRQLANELYVKSGLEKQMHDIGHALLAGYRNNLRKSTRHTARDRKIENNIAQTIISSFDTQAMRKTIVEGMRRDISPDSMKDNLLWFDSPVSKKIVAMEKSASSKEGVIEFQKYIRNIRKMSFQPERIRHIKNLNTSMNIIQTTVDIALSTQFALSMTTRRAKNVLSRDDVSRLYNGFKKRRSQIEPIIKNQVYGSLLYTYQKLSDEELGAYVVFVQSESGQKFSRVTSFFIHKAITESCLQFAWEIAQL